MGVEPTPRHAGDEATVLKTARTTGPYPLPRTAILPRSARGASAPTQAGNARPTLTRLPEEFVHLLNGFERLLVNHVWLELSD